MDMNQDKFLEKARAIERLDTTLKVVGVKGWVVLIFFIALLGLTLAWSVMGSIPITISGKCIVFAPESSIRIRSSFTGKITGVAVKIGDQVHEGSPIATLEGGETIVSPAEGTISWVDVVTGSVVEPEGIVAWVQKPSPPESLTILGFFPLYSGQQIKNGMKANISLDQVDAARYGMAKGIVTEVLDYPIAPDDYYMQKIPSAPLRTYLISGSTPTIGVVVKPEIDPHNPSGWKWTSEAGPKQAIPPGSIGEMRIILDQWKPIAFLFPSLQRSK